MNRIECSRETEMLQVVVAGQWPDGCDPEQRAHVRTCGICADLIEVAVALSNDRETTVRNAPVPASGAVWWRARMRMRQDALRASQRTVAVVQVAMLGAGLIVACAVLSATSMLPQGWLGSLGRLFGGIGLGAITRGIQWSLPLCVALLVWLAASSVAAHFAPTDD